MDLESAKQLVLSSLANSLLVAGSSFSLTNQRAQTTKIYLEIQKDRKFFSSQEVSLFRKKIPELVLDQAQDSSIPPINLNNKELLIKSFHWIMRDIEKNDLPHVFIDFIKGVANTFQFSALVCRFKKPNKPSLNVLLEHPDVRIEASTTYEEKGWVKEGVMMEFCVPIDERPSLVRARKKSALLIQSLLGDFRDVNGGLLEKIEENFELFSAKISAPLSILETFFYSITPQERQATASIEALQVLYQLQDQQRKETKETDYAVYENETLVCCSLKIPGDFFEKEFRHSLLSHFPELLFATMDTRYANIVGCVLSKNHEEDSARLKDLAFSFYQDWLQKKEIKQVLRISSSVYFTSFDPRIGTEEETSYLHKMIFEGLMRIGPDGSIQNGIAHKIDITQNGCHYRFFLRKSF